MTTYYVGSGGSNANNGTSWATRKLTLNGVEDIPVAAGDIVYVAPGVYRELLTVDVAGSAGNIITYIGDVTGEHTDGIGGVVRITGSDNDTTVTRQYGLTASGKNYRSWQGLHFDLVSSAAIDCGGSCSYWTVDGCTFGDRGSATAISSNTAGSDWTIKNCLFFGANASSSVVSIQSSSTRNDQNILVQNCLWLLGGNYLVVSRVGGVVVKNCTFYGGSRHIQVSNALAAGQTVTVNNCIFSGAVYRSLESTTSGELAENYNTFWANAADRTTTGVGANSVAYPPLFLPTVLLTSIRFPWQAGALSEWSAMRALAGTGMATDDLFGVTRPATDSKKSWGAVQYTEPRRDTATKRTGAASVKLGDAGRHQIFVPTANASTVFSVYAYWGADYAGTKPQLVIKQPGQSATTVTATGSAGSWELLTTTLTPAASPGYCVVELVSNNSATSGSYAVNFDDLTVV